MRYDMRTGLLCITLYMDRRSLVRWHEDIRPISQCTSPILYNAPVSYPKMHHYDYLVLLPQWFMIMSWHGSVWRFPIFKNDSLIYNKANLRDLIAATSLVILLKLDLNRRFFSLCDLEIWRMTLKNNRAPLLWYFKLFASFRSHWWIQTGVTFRKRLIWVKMDDFF